ncbi:hypothetical protein EV368DRAFT_66023 [Lentinula lateritia]|nr:hypothetical protein EV368DRAFT_66023 [Lentinula lateritia]
MLTDEDYQMLLEASVSFLERKDFGIVELEEVMDQVFGQNRGGKDAKAWSMHWTQLSLYEEQVHEGRSIGPPPKIPSHSRDNSDLDRPCQPQLQNKSESEEPGQTQLSNALLQNTITAIMHVLEHFLMLFNSLEWNWPIRGKKRKIEDESHKREPILTSVSPLDSTSTQTGSDTAAQPALEASWGEVTKLTAARQAQIDYFLLHFIICCAIAFSIMDNGFFRDFIHALCPAYSLPDQSSLFTAHIAAEAANVANQVLVFLATFIYLTISFDGWSSKRGDEIYTVHITTPMRCSFLVDGLILTGESTDAKSLFTRIGEWPWILNCPDPCHQLNLMMKDVMVGSKNIQKFLHLQK